MTTTCLVTAGRGPAEARAFVALLAEHLHRRAQQARLQPSALELQERPPRSAHFTFEALPETLGVAAGTHELLSPLRGRGRKRWFASVRLDLQSREQTFDSTAVDLHRCRAGGPGGQHVNKRNTAVLAVHRPTGLSARASRQRSQRQNQSMALQTLAERQIEHLRGVAAAAARRQWRQHDALIRGNPVCSYTLGRDGQLVITSR